MPGAHLPSRSATTPSGSQASRVNPDLARAPPTDASRSADTSPTRTLPADRRGRRRVTSLRTQAQTKQGDDANA